MPRITLSAATALILVATLAALSETAQAQAAGDGAIPIDQAKAMAGNVTPGDLPGFPVVITQPGLYRLTGPLTVTDPSQTAIDIRASHVSLDLNGFTISGPNSCKPNPGGPGVLCTYARNSATGRGIEAGGNGATHVSVRNGAVRGFVGAGVLLGEWSTAMDLAVAEISGTGLLANRGSRIERVAVAYSGEYGVYARDAVISHANLGFNQAGLRLDGGLLLDSVVSNSTNSLASFQGSVGFRGVHFYGTGSLLTNPGVSMGGNLCKGQPC